MDIKVGDKVRDNIGRTGEVVRVNTSVRVKYDPGQDFTWSGYGIYSEPFNLTVIPPEKFPVGTRVRVSDRYSIRDQRGTEGTTTAPANPNDHVWVKVTKPAAHYDYAGITHAYPISVLDEIKEEPKPTFEVGDRVRVIGASISTFIGVEGVVTEVGRSRAIVLYTDVSKASNGGIKKGETGGFLFGWLEMIDAKPLSIGDRVRVQKAASSHENGYTGRIVRAAPVTSPDDWFVEIDGRTLFGEPLQLSFKASSLVRA